MLLMMIEATLLELGMGLVLGFLLRVPTCKNPRLFARSWPWLAHRENKVKLSPAKLELGLSLAIKLKRLSHERLV